MRPPYHEPEAITSSCSRATLDLNSSVPSGIVPAVPTCRFCPRVIDDQFALTVREPGGDWARVVEPTCLRCLALLRRAGAGGLKLKASGERWYLGHGRGLYDAPHERGC